MGVIKGGRLGSEAKAVRRLAWVHGATTIRTNDPLYLISTGDNYYKAL